MNYKETVEYLYNQLPVYQNIGGIAYKEGLYNSLALDAYFGHPHQKFKTIHVAGTNGKGSTSHLLAAILQQSGYKTGLYTSPHLIDFRERIRVNGKKISEDYVIDFVAKHRSFFEPIHPSFFELTMMMAFNYFASEQVDVAVIEVGLGGRLDSTNIITPDLSIITNISFDHVQYLGNTLQKIAIEKAGIMKPDVPVVIGEANTETREVFEEKAHEILSPIVFTQDRNQILSYAKLDENWIFETRHYPKLKCELGGEVQLKNTETVLTALDILQSKGYEIKKEAVYEGFAHVSELTGLLGRWQIIGLNPKVICDTGHNVAGIEYVVNQLKKETYNALRIVIGMVNDKDISNVLALLPKEAVYYFTQASIARALNVEELKRQSEQFQLKGYLYTSVELAVKQALVDANLDDVIFIGGSNFVVGEALPLFNVC